MGLHLTKRVVHDEVVRLTGGGREPGAPASSDRTAARVVYLLGSTKAARLDRFDRVQPEDVLSVCATSKTLSEAGRRVFAHSRETKASSNDADRIRQYLARFDIAWGDIGAMDVRARGAGDPSP